MSELMYELRGLLSSMPVSTNLFLPMKISTAEMSCFSVKIISVDISVFINQSVAKTIIFTIISCFSCSTATLLPFALRTRSSPLRTCSLLSSAASPSGKCHPLSPSLGFHDVGLSLAQAFTTLAPPSRSWYRNP
jgi:hypothetical protein